MDLENGSEAHYCSYYINTSKSQVTVMMTLRNFSQECKKPDVVFRSPTFSFSNATWKIQVSPNSQKTDETKGRILLFLGRISSSVSAHKLSLTVGFRDRSREIVRERTVELQFHDATPLGVRTTVELEDVIGGNMVDILLEDSLTVCCNIKDGSIDEEAEDDIQNGELIPHSLDVLAKDYENLYNTGDYSDVTLRTKKEEISAHRAILGARSEVFSEMFKHNTPSNTYAVEDVDPESLRNLLFYIYSGKVQELSSDNVARLFVAAEKFAVEDLKLTCKSYMKRNLSVANVCDVIILSEKYNLQDLSLMAKRFLHKHAAEVVESKEWSYFEVECPDLALTLLRSFVRTHKTGEDPKTAATAENSETTRLGPGNMDSGVSSMRICLACILLVYLISVICCCFKEISSNAEL